MLDRGWSPRLGNAQRLAGKEAAMSDQVGVAFMKKTRYEYLGVSDQSRGLIQPPLEVAPRQGARVLDLPSPAAETS